MLLFYHYINSIGLERYPKTLQIYLQLYIYIYIKTDQVYVALTPPSLGTLLTPPLPPLLANHLLLHHLVVLHHLILLVHLLHHHSLLLPQQPSHLRLGLLNMKFMPAKEESFLKAVHQLPYENIICKNKDTIKRSSSASV